MRYYAVIAVCFVASIAQANAQDERCADALVSNNVAWEYDNSLRIATMSLIDRSNFEEKKRSLSLGGSFIVDALPISAYGSYDDFDQARSRELKKSTLNYDRREWAMYVAQYVPVEAFNAYSDCIRAKGQSSFGIHLIPVSIEDDYVALDLYWNPAPPVTAAKLKTEISGGDFTVSPPVELPPSTFHPLNVRRKQGEPLRLTVSANGFKPARLSVPLLVLPPASAKQPWEISGYRPRIDVVTHLQGVGDTKGRETSWVGTTGQSRRLEGFSADITDNIPGLSIEYMCHIEGFGDYTWIKEGKYCGTRGESRRLEGFAIRATGPAAAFFDVSYRCHLEGSGDSQVLLNGQYCGTRGESRRVEAILIEIKRK